jgi:glycosyltransferase involved in cell wall biosynthesis
MAAFGSHTISWSWPWRRLALRLLALRLARPDAFLLVGSEDDLSELQALSIDPGPRFAIVGGPGVDPEVFPVLPPAHGAMPVAAFVGPVTEAGGIRDLLVAFERLWARGLRLQLEVYGRPDASGGPGSLSADWARWGQHPGVRCATAWPADSREVWRRAEICVWPEHARKGLPRAVLEAAACGRALIVTDAAAGCSFVREGVEGLIVPARDDQALGAALERLARDAALRQRLGAAARLRVVQSFTEAHVKAALRGVYLSLRAPAWGSAAPAVIWS